MRIWISQNILFFSGNLFGPEMFLCSDIDRQIGSSSKGRIKIGRLVMLLRHTSKINAQQQ